MEWGGYNDVGLAYGRVECRCQRHCQGYAAFNLVYLYFINYL